APAGSGQIIVWGAAPSDTRIEIDGVEIPALYHFGGVRSVVHPDLVGGVSLVPGGYGPDHGRALGGLGSVTTAPLSGPGLHGTLPADLLDAAVSLRSRVGRLRVAAAARYGWLDRVLAGAISDNVAELFPIPRYQDGQVKATVGLRKDEEVGVLVLAS